MPAAKVYSSVSVCIVHPKLLTEFLLNVLS